MKKQQVVSILVSALCCTLAAEAAVKIDAVQFDSLQGQVHRANLGRTGVWKTSGVKSKPSVVWEFKTGGPVRSSPVLVNGTVYVGSYDGNVYAIDAASGKQRWCFKTGGKVSGSAAVVDGRVIVAAEDGHVYCLNASDGTQKWKAEAPRTFAIAGSPAVLYDTVFIGGGQRGGSERVKMSGTPIYGFDLQTGKAVWTSQRSGPQGYAAISTDGIRLYAGQGDSYGSFDIATQKSAGNFRGGHQSRQFMSMTFANDKVYIPVTMRGSVMCVVKDSGNCSQGLLWHTAMLDGQLDIELNQGGQFGYEIFTDLAVTETAVFSGCNDGKLYTFDADTGKKGWTFATEGKVQSSPSVADGVVYFGSWDGNLYAVDTASGKLLWKQPLGGRIISSPWPGDGVIYVGCDNGSLYAIH